jgi:hypothetical protein
MQVIAGSYNIVGLQVSDPPLLHLVEFWLTLNFNNLLINYSKLIKVL